MSLAEGRAPRRTAGNRLSGLLQAEEEDEFYQTTYGGFTEESGDDEYRGDQSDSDDEVDSDFDIDEGEEPASDQDDSEPKRRRRIITKAYRVRGAPGGSTRGREGRGGHRGVGSGGGSRGAAQGPPQTAAGPPRRGCSRVPRGGGQDSAGRGHSPWVGECGMEPLKSLRPKKADAPSSSSQKAREVKSAPLELQDEVADSRKHMRQSTTEHTRQTFLRIQERQVQSKRKKGGPNYDRPLTQEELLEEAKITEEINLRSLENYERLEADKKKQVQKKRKCVGPVIRYWSVTMPLITELGKEENVDVEGLDQDLQQAEAAPAAAPASAGKCSRTFISFTDDETFERFFPKAKPPRLPVREICPVTHKPAVYRDPITDIPYSNIRAFKIIREAYKKYITAHGLPSAAASTALGAAPPGPDPSVRATRQKIIIKQSVPAT
ncbi:Transcription factor-like 1 [Aix galericulata]|nr:Transcription factor-like 1 [Aix galericulata]